MKLSLYPYQLKFKFPFRIAHGVRTHTDVVYVKLEHEGFTAWGEATLPPYLPETQKSVSEFLLAFNKNISSNSIVDWFEKLNPIQTNLSAKAALDIALWNLKAQIENKTIGELLGISKGNYPQCTYTIGACKSFDEMKMKVTHGLENGFQLFKLKLTSANPLDTISWFRFSTDKAFAVDTNQVWQIETNVAGHFINVVFKDEGCVLVEQPFPKAEWEKTKELKAISEIPIYADESCQRLSDIENLKDCFDGVNIKLMKCGGITEAHQMILRARELEMKVLIGCMSESSVGCTAAAHLTPLADYADLDGPYLISNDPFEGMKIKDGRIQLNPLKEKIQFT